MERAGDFMDGLSLHYYTVPGEWAKKGSATEFDTRDWFVTMRKALYTEELLAKHGAIMDRFDPEKRVALVMDEWGAWYDVEPGTNPGFLYQQNTMRDALVAGIHLNIFNNHAERLRMANLAQTVNVLQAVILTEGPKMLLTPTYHVFDLYQEHQEAVRLPVYAEAESAEGIPLVSASASQSDTGAILVTLTNSDPVREQRVKIELRGVTPGASCEASARVLAGGAIQARNTFEAPGAVGPEPLAGVEIARGAVTLTLPAHSVAAVRLA